METFEILAKKSKRKRLWKTVAISSLVSLALLLLLGKGLIELASSNGRNLQKEYEVMSEIAYPNVDYDSLYYTQNSLFSGTLHSDRFKDLDGVKVTYPSYEGNYSLIGAFRDPTAEGTYLSLSGTYTRELRQKYPVFYNINAKGTIDTKRIPQELASVKEMPNQLVEVALTFDKAYTYKEIQQMIPSNLKINWYWIGSQSEDVDNTGALRTDPKTTYGANAGLLFTYDSDVRKKAKEAKKEQQTFLDYLKKADKNLFPSVSGYNTYNDVESYLKKFGQLDIREEENRDQLTFSGVILTGKAENFAQLEEKEWIYASSIGASVPNQPYYKLDKE
ncbi:anti sigma factor C-terminal domain-containing protein [Streptococcus sp. Marseille-P6264]|uniref:anti sigma factor C-terminal domain-containing protein n=1 Tax=Streptococcus sp. Marseille-P6264 TaxID=2487315 RepID=UPI0011E758D3|nr:anti sigma factor C-terminal domain-containing protein [Streptococcus sp. Marseille-P6264]